MKDRKLAAVSLIIRADGRLLCVFNQRYNGWTLPGGRVEDGETPEDAQGRELFEETGCRVFRWRQLEYVAPVVPPAPHADRASQVLVYRCDVSGEPYEAEKGSPVAWMTRDAFLDGCPFRDFYARMFAAGIDTSPTI